MSTNEKIFCCLSIAVNESKSNRQELNAFSTIFPSLITMTGSPVIILLRAFDFISRKAITNVKSVQPVSAIKPFSKSTSLFKTKFAAMEPMEIADTKLKNVIWLISFRPRILVNKNKERKPSVILPICSQISILIPPFFLLHSHYRLISQLINLINKNRELGDREVFYGDTFLFNSFIIQFPPSS